MTSPDLQRCRFKDRPRNVRILGKLLLLAILGLPLAAEARQNLDDGTAIQGFDPVSYFDRVPRMGDRDIIVIHAGATYRFFNEANRKRFVSDPDRFVPAFGGFCAWGVLDDDDHEDIHPGSWKIVNDRLLLFYKGYLGDGKRDWNDAATVRGGDQALLENAETTWRRMQTD